MNKIIIMSFAILIILGWNSRKEKKEAKVDQIEQFYKLTKIDAG